MTRIAFIVQLPEKTSPSQRFRIELWEPVLAQQNIHFDTYSFLDKATHSIIYKPGNTIKKIAGVAKGFINRIRLLAKVNRYDYLFIQREATPVGFPFFEWISAKFFKAKIIYDFDDAMWVGDASSANKLANLIKARWKIKYICTWAYKVVAGNNYLAAYALQYNKNVILIPTCVNTTKAYNKVKKHKEGKLVVGWIGSHTTLKYLNEVVPVLQQLEKEIDFTFLLVVNEEPQVQVNNMRYKQWNAATETDDILMMDIGIMPLAPDKWCNGKCGLKLIQYLSLGIPAIASPVGVNNIIIENGYNGFLCTDAEEWISALKKLIINVDLRKTMGISGREKIINEYSIQSQTDNFLNLFT